MIRDFIAQWIAPYKWAIVATALIAVAGYHRLAVRSAYNSGVKAERARQVEAMQQADKKADAGQNNPSMLACHARQNAGERVIWQRREKTCAPLQP